MKKMSLGIILACLGTQVVEAQSVKYVDPFTMVKEINHLYLAVIMDEVNDGQKKQIMCKQLPDKIQQYLQMPQPDKIVQSYMLQAISSVRSNVEMTKNTLRISCRR